MDKNNIKMDLHIHTKLCKHATGEMEEYVQKAIELGLKEMAFTDHIPLPYGFDIRHRMSEEQLTDYVEAVLALQKQYPQIKIHLGIEADFYDGFEDYLEKTLTTYPFEIIILSVHFIRSWPDGNWVFNYHFPEKSVKQIYSEYLQAVLRGIKTGFFNVVGHLDLIKQKDQPLLRHNEMEVREILAAAKQKMMAIEINTSGLRKAIGEPYPQFSLFPLIAESGVPITVGSDAHAPEQVGFAFDEIQKELAQIPELHIAHFEGRKVQPKPLNGHRRYS